MLRFLVLATDYPNLEGGLALAYIRTRNLYYKEHGIHVDVINFSARENYIIDGINVFAYDWFKKNQNTLDVYDLCISHAPNLRNHYLFLLKYGYLFSKIVFFFHGHEVLKINEVYSKPYPYIRRNKFKEILQDWYDELKFFVWRNYFKFVHKKIYYVFVSNWMKGEFDKWIKLPEKYMKERMFITYNSVGSIFENNTFVANVNKKYDFVTIRANLDGSKYSIDIVNKLAKGNPKLKFLVVGKGDFFKHNKKSCNLEWLNKTLKHDEMLQVLNSAHCAFMPTRTDAQGVMMCEMLAYGMPLLTSNIPVCHEVFEDFKRVGYVDNENPESFDINSFLNYVKDLPITKHEKFYYSKVCNKELKDLISIVNG